MRIELKIEDLSVTGCTYKSIYVILNGVEISEIISEIGIGKILNEIGKDEVIKHFDINVADEND
jgi:hypothetical protein